MTDTADDTVVEMTTPMFDELCEELGIVPEQPEVDE